MLKTIAGIFLIGLTATASLVAQTQDVALVLTEAQKQTVTYQEAFKNLLATETKTVEQYGKNGEIKNQKVVEANFLVYQSSKNAKISSELRSVTKVDGKQVPDSVERTNRLFEELQKTTTLKSELEKIQKEGNRYDKSIEIDGVTLYEGVVLSSKFQPYFDFKLAGVENHEGSDVYVINYTQVKTCPYISLNARDERAGEPDDLDLVFNFEIPKSLRNAEPFLHGTLWIDTKTYQIRREERNLSVKSDTPIVLLETILEYQPSNYEIMVPHRISFVLNNVKSKDDKNGVEKDVKATFDYSEFKKSETDVKIVDDTPDK